MKGKLRLRCYVCGESVRDSFSLATMSSDTDRVFLVHDKCAEQLEKSSTSIIKVATITPKQIEAQVEAIVGEVVAITHSREANKLRNQIKAVLKL